MRYDLTDFDGSAIEPVLPKGGPASSARTTATS